MLNNKYKSGLRREKEVKWSRDTIDLMMRVCNKNSENRFGFVTVYLLEVDFLTSLIFYV